MELKQWQPYRLDYIGQDLYEKDGDSYQRVKKTGCVYIYPRELSFTEDGFLANYEDFNGNPLRVRVFPDYVVLEPSGIIVQNENITPVDWKAVLPHSKERILTAKNSEEAQEVCFDTFFGNYCRTKRYGNRIEGLTFEKEKQTLLKNIKNEETKEGISTYDYVCLFCFYLLNTGRKSFDMESFNDYVYSLLISKKHKDEFPFDRTDFYSQFASLMYQGVLHDNYDYVDKTINRPFVDEYDPDTGQLLYHHEEVTRWRFDEMHVDTSKEVRDFLQQKYEENKIHYGEVVKFARKFLYFYSQFLNHASKEDMSYQTLKRVP